MGGMGIVIAATHLHLAERVAMKFLLPEVSGNREVLERFLREAQSAVRLKGEHIARVMDVGATPDGQPYIVMEFLDGIDLGRMLEERRALPVGEAVDYVLAVCEALAEAHAHRIVHRDVKPANIFLTRRPDGSPLVKVLDFGISKAPMPHGGSLTHSFVSMGTPAYMSPEQMHSARDVGATADVWALGIVLYECLAGRRPFDAGSLSGLALRIAMDPTPRLHAGLPGDLAPRHLPLSREGALRSVHVDGRSGSGAGAARYRPPRRGDDRRAHAHDLRWSHSRPGRPGGQHAGPGLHSRQEARGPRSSDLDSGGDRDDLPDRASRSRASSERGFCRAFSSRALARGRPDASCL
jgi:serine/threonine protein kinase